ncbi:MAG: DNA polymerase Y family protein, partial [Planctomycetota bacterium]
MNDSMENEPTENAPSESHPPSQQRMMGDVTTSTTSTSMGSAPTKNDATSPPPWHPRWLCVWLPNWPIQRLRRSSAQRDAVAGHSIVLWDQHPRRGRLTVAACIEARRAGVRIGRPVHEAAEVLAQRRSRAAESDTNKSDTTQSDAAQTDTNRSETAQSNTAPPDATPFYIAQHDRDADQNALQKLADWMAIHISPLVAIEWLEDPHRQAQSIVLNVTGIGTFFGDEATMLETLRDAMQRFGLRSRMAVADTVAAAWAVTRYTPDDPDSDDPLEDPYWILPPGDVLCGTLALPPAAMRLHDDVLEKLRRLGIRSIAQLLRLPRAGLATRLGRDLMLAIDRLLGDAPEPLSMQTPAPEDTAALTLQYPTDSLEILQHRLRSLVQEVRAGLATRERGALHTACRLDLSAHPPLTVRVGTFEPTCDADHLSDLLDGQMETLALPSSVTRMTVTV